MSSGSREQAIARENVHAYLRRIVDVGVDQAEFLAHAVVFQQGTMAERLEADARMQEMLRQHNNLLTDRQSFLDDLEALFPLEGSQSHTRLLNILARFDLLRSVDTSAHAASVAAGTRAGEGASLSDVGDTNSSSISTEDSSSLPYHFYQGSELHSLAGSTALSTIQESLPSGANSLSYSASSAAAAAAVAAESHTSREEQATMTTHHSGGTTTSTLLGESLIPENEEKEEEEEEKEEEESEEVEGQAASLSATSVVPWQMRLQLTVNMDTSGGDALQDLVSADEVLGDFSIDEEEADELTELFLPTSPSSSP